MLLGSTSQSCLLLLLLSAAAAAAAAAGLHWISPFLFDFLLRDVSINVILSIISSFCYDGCNCVC